METLVLKAVDAPKPDKTIFFFLISLWGKKIIKQEGHFRGVCHYKLKYEAALGEGI